MKTLIRERNKIAKKPKLVIAKREVNCISKCSFCQHYAMETGSFGQCQLLSAPVRGAWESCSLGTPVFEQN